MPEILISCARYMLALLGRHALHATLYLGDGIAERDRRINGDDESLECSK